LKNCHTSVGGGSLWRDFSVKVSYTNLVISLQETLAEKGTL